MGDLLFLSIKAKLRPIFSFSTKKRKCNFFSVFQLTHFEKWLLSHFQESDVVACFSSDLCHVFYHQVFLLIYINVFFWDTSKLSDSWHAVTTCWGVPYSNQIVSGTHFIFSNLHTFPLFWVKFAHIFIFSGPIFTHFIFSGPIHTFPLESNLHTFLFFWVKFATILILLCLTSIVRLSCIVQESSVYNANNALHSVTLRSESTNTCATWSTSWPTDWKHPQRNSYPVFWLFSVQSQHCSLGQGVGQLKESLARTPCVDGAKQPPMTNMGGRHQILNGSPRWFCKLTFLFWWNNKTYEAASNCQWQCVLFSRLIFNV